MHLTVDISSAQDRFSSGHSLPRNLTFIIQQAHINMSYQQYVPSISDAHPSTHTDSYHGSAPRYPTTESDIGGPYLLGGTNQATMTTDTGGMPGYDPPRIAESGVQIPASSTGNQQWHPTFDSSAPYSPQDYKTMRDERDFHVEGNNMKFVMLQEAFATTDKAQECSQYLIAELQAAKVTCSSLDTENSRLDTENQSLRDEINRLKDENSRLCSLVGPKSDEQLDARWKQLFRGEPSGHWRKQ